MTAWGACSLVQIVSTTHTLRLYSLRDTRNSSAISKTCLSVSVVSAVSAPAIAANEPILPSRLCSKKFRSWLECRRLVRSLRGEHAVWSVFPNRGSRHLSKRARFCGDFAACSGRLRVSAVNGGLSGGFLASSLCIHKFRSWRLEFRGGTGQPALWNRLPRCAARSLIAGSIRAFRTVGSIPWASRGAAQPRCREATDLRPRL